MSDVISKSLILGQKYPPTKTVSQKIAIDQSIGTEIFLSPERIELS